MHSISLDNTELKSVHRFPLELNTELLLFEIKKVLDRYTALQYENQWCLQLPEGKTNPLYGAREGKYLDHTEDQFTEWVFETMRYTCTVVEMLGLYRTRYMRNSPKTCMSYHQDPTKRIHIPLVTDPDCMILVGDTVHHLEVGSYYLVDTTQKHSFLNMSKKCERIHLIGCV